MIIQADVVGLEVLCAAFLSQDKVLYEELNNKVDIHSTNQGAFGLPHRGIAKILKFRILYGGSEYGFVKDPDFTCVSSSLKYWRTAIEKYYSKYKGIASWHQQIVREVSKTSKLFMPTGRGYSWDLNKYGSFKVPEPQVKNYGGQGFGADIMSVARVSFARRFAAAGIKGVLINTVHDSIVVDIEKGERDKVCKIFNEVFADLPKNISKIFDLDFNLEVRVELLAGNNQGDLHEIKA